MKGYFFPAPYRWVRVDVSYRNYRFAKQNRWRNYYPTSPIKEQIKRACRSAHWCYHWHGCSPSPVWQYWNNSRRRSTRDASSYCCNQIALIVRHHRYASIVAGLMSGINCHNLSPTTALAFPPRDYVGYLFPKSLQGCCAAMPTHWGYSSPRWSNDSQPGAS